MSAPRVLRALLAAAVASLALALAGRAAAYETVDDVLCACVPDAINTGDFVSCVSALSRRLVVKGALSQEERSDLVSSAAHLDREAIAEECQRRALPGDFPSGWGVAIDLDSPFHPDPAVTGTASVVTGRFLQWNFTGEDAYQFVLRSVNEDCGWRIRVLDSTGRLVRQPTRTCGPTIARRDMPGGSTYTVSLSFPLEARAAETGLADGTPLPRGLYRVEATFQVEGPQHSDTFTAAGGKPMATAAIRIGDD